MPDPERAVAEFRRVLVDDGLLVISTPNADEYLVENEFHQTELSTTELLDLLAGRFPVLRRLYQQNWLLSAILDEHQLRSADVARSLRAELVKAVGIEPGVSCTQWSCVDRFREGLRQWRSDRRLRGAPHGD